VITTLKVEILELTDLLICYEYIGDINYPSLNRLFNYCFIIAIKTLWF